ncbi:hypothetical protein NQ317_019330 [Molorchus minor]|uniref:Uncharacterized protein n=1 Tax=Molorchus minor TaxID=1323400 RepID=A0ABQ9ITP4_9CUCU|nr:hypothetical protein NQ317_019330 [Molorchus minor]
MKVVYIFGLLLILGICSVDAKRKPKSDCSNSTSSSSSSSSSEDTSCPKERRARSLEFQISQISQLRKVLKNVTRMINHSTKDLEEAVISNCIRTGHKDIADSLQAIFANMMNCIHNKPMAVTSKDQYIHNLEGCSKEAMEKSYICLEDKTYFPGLILKLVKTIIETFYDNRGYIRGYLSACLPKMNTYTLQRKYDQCISDSFSMQNGYASKIPQSKAAFCKTYKPVSYCFINVIKENCGSISENSDKITEDHFNPLKQICYEKMP